MTARRGHLATDWWAVGVFGPFTVTLFSSLRTAVARQHTTGVDSGVRHWVVGHQSPRAVTLFTWVSGVGQPRWVHAAALAGAGLLLRRGHRLVAIRCVAVALVSMGLYESAKRIYARARPLGIGDITE